MNEFKQIYEHYFIGIILENFKEYLNKLHLLCVSLANCVFKVSKCLGESQYAQVEVVRYRKNYIKSRTIMKVDP